MTKEQVDLWCKENYGFTIDEADENIGWLMDKFSMYQERIEFLRKRENKLQLIEQMFKSGTIDLKELSNLVKGSEE